MVGTALETFHGTKSITFKREPRDESVGSAVLVENSGHVGDLWSVHLADGADIHLLPPYYVMNAAALLMGFRWINVRHGRGIYAFGASPSPSPPSYFLAETSNASVAYFEEAGETITVDQQTEPLKDGDEDANTKANEVAGEKTDA